jgi:hypothetical protein
MDIFFDFSSSFFLFYHFDVDNQMAQRNQKDGEKNI